VRDPGGAMATKRTPTKKTRPAKKATKKRTSKAPPKKRVSQGPAKKRTSKPPAKKRTTKAPAKSSRPTKPAKRRARKAAPASVPVPAPAPVPAPVPASVPVPVPPRKDDASRPPRGEAPARPASYLEGTPQDHAELVSGLFQVVRGAAKDLKTLVTQAIAMSTQKNDRFDR
jgi:hypothetical protein